MNSAPGVACHRQPGVGRRVQKRIRAIAVSGLERRADQRVHDLLQLQQQLRVIVDLLQRDALLYQHPLYLTAELLGELQAPGGQVIQVAGKAVLGIVQVELHHLMELLVVLGKGSGNGQKEDDRRKNHQDHGHPVEHQLSLHAYALPFGKGIQGPELLELVQHGRSSSPGLSGHDLPKCLEPICTDLFQPGLSPI